MNALLPASALASARAPARAPDRPAFDEQGFLVDGDRWDAALAARLAAEEGIDTLDARRWSVIHGVRHRFHEFGALPVMRLVCRAAGLDPRQAHALFGSCRSLWRIAGLPHPGDEALAYMH